MVYIEYININLNNYAWVPENYDDERWVKILDSDGNFLISDYGRVKRIEHSITYGNGYEKYFSESFININFNKGNGYLYVSYRGFDLKRRYCSIHRLVASHFVENENLEEYDQVNHIYATRDIYGKTINHYRNLEWCNAKQNCEHSVKNGLFNFSSEKRKSQAPINSKENSYKNWVKVVEYDVNGNFIKIHDGVVNLRKDKNIKISTDRLSYGNCFYLDYNTMMKKYKSIPKYINFDRINNVRNNRRHIYNEHTYDEKINIYTTIKDLPISREELYYAILHNIEDKNLSHWEVLNASDTGNEFHSGKYHIKIYDETSNMIFQNSWDCAKWLKENCNLSAKIDSIMQTINRSKKSYGYNIEKLLKEGDNPE